MKKLLIVSNFFKPGFRAGGPIKSIDLICKNLKDDYNILVVTSSRDIGTYQNYDDIKPNTILNRDGYKVIYLSAYNFLNIFFQVKRYKPNLIYMNSIFSSQNIYIFFLNRLINLPNIVLAPRGEISENALKIKRFKKKIVVHIFKIFKVFKNIDFHATDKFEANYLKKVFPKNDIWVIKNFVSDQIIQPKKLPKKVNHINMCFASRISEKKNLKFALNVLNDSKLKNFQLNFDIWGPIEDSSYWQECQKIISSLPKNTTVSYLGTFNAYNQVEKLSDYQLFFFPTLNENFGHIIFESMQLGIVPLISNNTPWTGINKFGAGIFDLDHQDKFVDYLARFAKLDEKNFSKVSEMIVQYATENINNTEIKKKYVSLFNEKSS